MNTLFSLRRVFAVDKGEHDYVNVSASPSQIGGGGGCEKLCLPLEKFWLRPCIVLYSSPVSTFIPSKSQQTEKSGEGIDFSLRENNYGFKVARTHLYVCWLCFKIALFGRKNVIDFYDSSHP